MGKTVVVACGLSVGVFAQVCYAADAVRVHHDEGLFPLTEVRLTGGPLQAQQEQTRKYLLRLEPDRLLSRFRRCPFRRTRLRILRSIWSARR